MNALKDFWNKFIILLIMLVFIIIINNGINSTVIDNVLTNDNKNVTDTNTDTSIDTSSTNKKSNNNDDKTTSKTSSNIKKGSYIAEPKQVNIKSSSPVNVTIGGVKVSMTKLASYDITGVVLDTATFNDVVGPIDVGLAWGILAQNNNYKGLTSYHVDNRRLTWYSNDENWLKKVGGSSAVSKSCSNNHLVPADDNIRKQILKIKRDTYIRLQGYLVYLEWQVGNTKYTWGPSSLTRADSGDGACEIIYVQSIQFL